MTLDAPADRIERFHQVLVERIRDLRPDYLRSPFTVAEIYQDLVPYATHRDRLGVEMNGDYEDILLRLLAGEGDYLALESSHARDRLRNELRSPNPDTGLYREFAAVDVRLNPRRVPGDAEEAAGVETHRGNGTPPEPAESPAADVGGHAGEAEPQVMDVEALAPASAEPGPGAAAFDEGASPRGRVESRSGSPSGSEAPPQCAWCREELPVRDNLNYCPFCGIDVHVVPCPSCGEALESNWRFCIACGAETSAD